MFYLWSGVLAFGRYDRRPPAPHGPWGPELEHDRAGLYLAISQKANPFTYLREREFRVCPDVEMHGGLDLFALDSHEAADRAARLVPGAVLRPARQGTPRAVPPGPAADRSSSPTARSRSRWTASTSASGRAWSSRSSPTPCRSWPSRRPTSRRGPGPESADANGQRRPTFEATASTPHPNSVASRSSSSTVHVPTRSPPRGPPPRSLAPPPAAPPRGAARSRGRGTARRPAPPEDRSPRSSGSPVTASGTSSRARSIESQLNEEISTVPREPHPLHGRGHRLDHRLPGGVERRPPREGS